MATRRSILGGNFQVPPSRPDDVRGIGDNLRRHDGMCGIQPDMDLDGIGDFCDPDDDGEANEPAFCDDDNYPDFETPMLVVIFFLDEVPNQEGAEETLDTNVELIEPAEEPDPDHND